MLTLALETSTSVGGVAVTRDDGQDFEILSRHVWSRDGSHGEVLTSAIENALTQAGITTADLGSIALGRGPGSFTGVRIAVNAARSLAYAIRKPVYPFTTHEILAAGAPAVGLPLVALVNAHKNMIYTARFTRDEGSPTWTRDGELQALTLEQLDALIDQPHLCVGDGYTEYENHFSPGLKSCLIRDSQVSDHPLPEFLSELAHRSRNSVSPLDWKDIQALYIRASGAEEKLRETREK